MEEQAEKWFVGDVIGGRYRLEEPIGAGAMGPVWRAEHLTLRSPVAVKLIHSEQELDDETIVRFMREA